MAIEITVLAEDETGAWVVVAEEVGPRAFIAFAVSETVLDASTVMGVDHFLIEPPTNNLHQQAQSAVYERILRFPGQMPAEPRRVEPSSITWVMPPMGIIN